MQSSSKKPLSPCTPILFWRARSTFPFLRSMLTRRDRTKTLVPGQSKALPACSIVDVVQLSLRVMQQVAGRRCSNRIDPCTSSEVAAHVIPHLKNRGQMSKHKVTNGLLGCANISPKTSAIDLFSMKQAPWLFLFAQAFAAKVVVSLSSDTLSQCSVRRRICAARHNC